MLLATSLLLLALGAWAGSIRTLEIRREDICKPSYPEFHPLTGDVGIELADTTLDVIMKLGNGNFGGTRVLTDYIRSYGKVYSLTPEEGREWALFHILAFDTHGITGSKLWMLYKDVCRQQIACVHTVMAALQSGCEQPNTVYCAIENRGYGLNVNALLSSVRKTLPDFAALGLDADYA